MRGVLKYHTRLSHDAPHNNGVLIFLVFYTSISGDWFSHYFRMIIFLLLAIPIHSLSGLLIRTKR